jgi:hypothetical protein
MEKIVKNFTLFTESIENEKRLSDDIIKILNDQIKN